MKFYPLFGLIMIFVIWFTYERKKHSRDIEKKSEEFWALDAEANAVRRKNLDTIEYLVIPVSDLPFGASDDEEILRLEQEMHDLSTKRILNLTGKTTTDIKLKYGAANLKTVSEYDDHYTAMVQTLYSWGERLYQLEKIDEAIKVLEFGIVSLTDISANYKLLCELYAKTNQLGKLSFLRENASKIDSLMKPVILGYIDEFEKTQTLDS